MNFWQYILGPTGASLGPVAMLAVIVTAFVGLAGIALIVLPKELAPLFAKLSSPRSSTGRKEAGPKERELQAELRVKVGTGIAVWSGALLLSLLLRLLGTPGLETRLLPTLVIMGLPLLLGSIIVYRLYFYPRYLELCRRIDTRKSYEPVTKKIKKNIDQTPRQQNIGLLPGKALLGAAILLIAYYLAMSAVSIPSNVPVQNHDHLLHQLGMPVLGLVGYTLGLAVSLGDDLRPMLPWLKPTGK